MMDRRLFWLIPLFCSQAAFAQVPPPGETLVRASDSVTQNLTVPPAAGPSTVDITAEPSADEIIPPPTARRTTQTAAQAAAANAAAAQTAEDRALQQQEAADNLAQALAEEAGRAAQAAANADAAKADAERKMNDRAYNSAVRGIFPMSNDQIKGLMRRMEDTQNAATPPSYGQPKPQVKVETISLDPGAEPPEIDVAVGYVTTLTLLDASGQPWPIVDIGVGGNFDIPTPEAGSHIIRITPMSRYGFGNLSLRMKDMTTPITFRLSAGNDIVHYRYDARVPMMGPNAKTPLIQRSKVTAGDDVIMSVLDNAIPGGAKKLKVNGTDRRTAAYKIGERTFVRTPLSMLSPSWDASVSSADGMTVYEVGDTPVVLLSDNGQMLRVRLSEEAIQ